jgi:tetratricopeptide (TPR) repeat protein
MNVNLRGETMYGSLVDEGAAQFEKKAYALAAACFWKAFRLRPGAPVVLFNIARTLEELDDPRSEDFYAAAGAQGSVDAHYQLARLCGASGRFNEAVEHLRAYLKGNPKEDACTQWARNAIRHLCPSPRLVWSKERRLHDREAGRLR